MTDRLRSVMTFNELSIQHNRETPKMRFLSIAIIPTPSEIQPFSTDT